MRISDWSSDVCSSDLPCRYPRYNRPPDIQNAQAPWRPVRQSDNYRDRRIPNLPRSSERRSAGTNGREAKIRVAHCAEAERKSDVEGHSGSVRVYLGARRILTTNKNTSHHIIIT